MKGIGPPTTAKKLLRVVVPLLFVSLAFVLVLVTVSTSVAEDYPDAYDMVADPVTSRFFESFSPSTIENGRIWVDKSVNVYENTFHDISGNPILTIDSANNEWLVTLSALTQSYSIETVVEPTDTVFVLDISSSMSAFSLDADTTRSEGMIEALNSAVRTIMEASPENRVAVVAYGGATGTGGQQVSRIVNVLDLAHYDLAEGQDYFSINPNGTTITPNLSMSPLPLVTSVAVNGGTPTQRGIYRGAEILYQVPPEETTYEYETEGGDTITVVRRPAIVLLTDGEPTFGWSDYQFANASSDTDPGYDAGNGVPGTGATPGDTGIDLLTVLTASYWKEMVREHYYGDEDRQMQFYTIGVGVQDNVHPLSVMDPQENAGDNSTTFQGTTYNMEVLLDAFVDPATGEITFPVVNRGTNSQTQRHTVTVANDGEVVVDGWAYTDGYYPADNVADLNEAFELIAYDIITKGNYTTGADPDAPDFSGYVVFSDTIGEHVRFSEFKGLLIGGVLHDGAAFARAATADPQSAEDAEILQAFAESLADRLSASSTGREVTDDEILALIESSVAAGLIYYNSDDDFGAVLRAYADENIDFLGSYYDENGDPLDPPEGAEGVVDWYPMSGPVTDEVTGQTTDLIHTYFSVMTALEELDFGLRGETGEPVPGVNIHVYGEQQLVRWYVPASLIPMRTVSEVYSSEDPELVTGLEIKEALPIRVNYTVRLRPDFDPSLLSEDYKAANSTPEGDGFYFYANDWRYAGGDDYDTTLALFEPNSYNPFYFFVENTPLYVLEGETFREATAADVGPDTQYYWQKEYFDSSVEGYIAYEFISVDQSITEVSTDGEGVPYVAAGQPRKVTFATIDKTDNPTGTATFRLDGEYFLAEIGGEIHGTELFLLGNNGRLTVPITSVSVEKVWEGTPLDSAWVQLYADGEPYRDPVELTAEDSWRHLWDELLLYQLEMDENSQVFQITYTVAEGTYEDGVFTPHLTEDPLGRYLVSYEQPQWQEGTGEWSGAVITNTRIPGPFVRLTKIITGIAETDQVFRFNLLDESGAVVATAQTEGTITEDGQIVSFPSFEDWEEGTYTLVIEEVGEEDPDWVYSTQSYEVTLTVAGGEVTVTYPEPYTNANPPIFTNEYIGETPSPSPSPSPSESPSESPSPSRTPSRSPSPDPPGGVVDMGGGDSPQTGDDGDVALWTTIGALSLAGLLTTAIRGQRWWRKG